MSAAHVDPGRAVPSAEREPPTPQVALRTLSQMEALAVQASDATLTSAVATGRRALAEWQALADQLSELKAEYGRLALSESRALSRLRDVLDLLDRFTGPAGEVAGGLAVRLLGPFELVIGGRRVTHWPGQQSQLLMQFLAAHRRRVRREELIAAVWPDADEDSGRHRLHQAVYELRSILRVAEPSHQPVVCTGGGYELAADLPVWVDVEEFDDLAGAATRGLGAGRAEEAIESGRRALRLYRGDFLQQVTEADWATVERNRLRSVFVQLSVNLAELLAERGDYEAALAAVDPVLAAEPWNEDATVIKMRGHAGAGARSLAVAAYRSCAEALSGEFGIGPAPRTRRVCDEIRMAEPVSPQSGLPGPLNRGAPRPASRRAPAGTRPSP